MHHFHTRALSALSAILMASILSAAFFIAAPSADAATFTSSQQQEFAAISFKLNSIIQAFNTLKNKLVHETKAQSTCSSSLITLLGTGCHYMYADSSGNSIYCDGGMTQSAKSGDTAVTAGCSGGYTYSPPPTYYTPPPTYYSPPPTYYTPPPSSSSGTCSSWLITLLGDGCHYMYADSSGNSIYCNTAMTQSAKSWDTVVTQGCTSPAGTTYSPPPTYYSPPPTYSGGGGSIPTTPANVTATYQSSANSILVSWPDNSYEDQFKVWRRASGGSWAYRDSFTYTAGATINYYDASGLTPGTTYEYMIQACLSNVCSPDSVVASAIFPSTATVTATAPPPPPSSTGTTATSAGLAANVSGSDVVLNWSDFYTGENEYQIERRTVGGTWTIIGVTTYLAGGTGTYRDVAPPSGTYNYHVKPCHSAGCSGESNIVTITIGGTVTTTVAPKTALAAPVISGISAINITTNSATIKWVTNIVANSKVEYWITTSTGEHRADPVFTMDHSIPLTGLLASTTYTYNVISDNQDYYRTTFSNQKFSTLSSAPGFSLVAPTGLAARTDTNGYDVVLTWTNNFYEDEYKVERRRSGESWATIASMRSQVNSGTYTDRSIPSGLYGTYEYRVKACGGGACSPESNIATVNVSGGASSSSCDSALTTLLGIGCHFMYNDSAGNAVYCDGGMTKSAKRGDTTTTSGCSGSSVTPAGTCSAITSQSLCVVDTSCGWIAGTGYGYCDAKSTYAGDATSCPGFSGSRWDKNGKRYCQLNKVASCQYSYPDYLDSAKYNSANCPADSSITPPPPPGGGTGGLWATVSGSDVVLNWSDFYQSEDEYQIERKSAGGVWTKIGTAPLLAGTSGTYRDPAVPTGYYDYRVKACTRTSGCVSESNMTTISVGGGYTVTCESFSAQSSCVVDTSCGWIAGTGYGYCERKATYAGDATSCPGFSYSRWDASGKRYCQLNKAAACQGVYPDYLDSAKYNAASCPGDTTGGMPAAPSELTAVQAGVDVVLSWNDNSGNENEYKVEWYNGSAWISIGSTGVVYGGRGTYTDRAPSARAHQYRVKACNSAGCSQESAIASITVGVTVAPSIFSLSPAAGSIGTKVLITGSGFTPTGNRINFDTGVLMDVPSSDGKTLVFIVPEDRVPLCAVTEPRCLLPAPYNPVKPGAYWVSVTNANGTSGSISFGVIERVGTTFAVDPAGTSPKSGATGVSVGTRIKVKFIREFDPSSTAKEFFRLTKTSTSGTYVAGSFAIFSDGFEFLPSGELEANTGYTYTVLSSIRDRNGIALPASYTASFVTGGVVSTNGTLTGKVTDSAGAPVGKAYVHVFPPYVYAQPSITASSPYYFSRNIETNADGSYQLSLPPGTYMVEVYPPSDRKDLTRVAPRELTIAGGETRTANFTFGGVVKVITGTVLFSNGAPVTDAEVGAYASETWQWTSGVTDSAGRYTLKVNGGTWFVGVHPLSREAKWAWNEKSKTITFGSDQVAETKTVDFTVPMRDITLSVLAVDELGVPLSGVGIIADTHSASSTSTFFLAPPEFRLTASDGKAKFVFRAGTYHVRAYLPSDRGYFNPNEQEVILLGGETKEIKLVFRKKQDTAALLISGTTKIEEGILVDAFVWAWSEHGGFSSVRADQQGKFSFKVTPYERWHVGAGKEYKGFPYKSPELVIEVKSEPVGVELVLTKQTLAPLPPTVSVSQAAAQQVVAQVTDGAKITVPPSGAAASGTVKIEINPTVEAPTQAGIDVVSTVYEVTIHDEAGKLVTSLSKEAEIVIPYSEADLKKQGVSEDAIVPSYFDDKSGTWVNLDDCTIDKERNAAICHVDHLTSFAITARADTTPPLAPTSVVTSASSGGKVTITWKNPVNDFDYAKIYRSSQIGELGTVRAATLRTTSFVDSEGLTNGTAYYYTVRAVDAAGNESDNTAQTKVVAIGTSGVGGSTVVVPPASTGSGDQKLSAGLTRTLRQGSKGADVELLQNMLTREGVYTGPITGYFGALTKAAVISFQEKYASEVLTPAGLSKGSGFVGSGTMKKINTLLSR